MKVLSGFFTTLPLVGLLNGLDVLGSISPESFDDTGMTIGVPVVVDATSSFALGGAMMVTVTVALEQLALPALQISYVNVSTPLNPGFGV